MAGKRTDIMEIRQIINLKQQGYSNRKVSELLSINRNTVNGYVRFFRDHSLGYRELLSLDDKELAELFPDPSGIDNKRYQELFQYFEHFRSELKKPGCTLLTLWQWYKERHPSGYSHSQFHYHFSKWQGKVKGSGKLEHKAGEKLFVDFTGKKLEIIDKETGEVIAVNVFVGVLPCSQYTYVEAVA